MRVPVVAVINIRVRFPSVRLDRFIARKTGSSVKTARQLILQGEVTLDLLPTTNILAEVDDFCEVRLNGRVVQDRVPRVYLILNKPSGVVSATRDEVHLTALDLIDHPLRESLHIAGRLDRFSTGLLLLTNDSTWSESFARPEFKVEKVYLVETVDPIPAEAVDLFARGFHFLPEDIVTRPAKLEILGEKKARVRLSEGKYHQVKRMFHRVGQIRLLSLHREQIGEIALPSDLKAGEWREIERFDPAPV